MKGAFLPIVLLSQMRQERNEGTILKLKSDHRAVIRWVLSAKQQVDIFVSKTRLPRTLLCSALQEAALLHEDESTRHCERREGGGGR